MYLKQYLITDPQYYSNDVKKFKKKLSFALEKNKVDIACFRDKYSSNYKELAEVFIQTCKEYKIKEILLNENYDLAKKLGATGVHLTSQQFNKISRAKELDLFVIISCHNIFEIEKAQKRYADAVTYSAIFDTPNKGKIKGIADLKKIRSIFDMNIIALGGIVSQKEVEQLKDINLYAFASIRYFI